MLTRIFQFDFSWRLFLISIILYFDFSLNIWQNLVYLVIYLGDILRSDIRRKIFFVANFTLFLQGSSLLIKNNSIDSPNSRLFSIHIPFWVFNPYYLTANLYNDQPQLLLDSIYISSVGHWYISLAIYTFLLINKRRIFRQVYNEFFNCKK